MGIIEYLINQSIEPKGLIGKLMLMTMNMAHKNIFNFGLDNIRINDNSKLLDLGFGGGEALKMISSKYKNIKLFGIDFSEESIKTGMKNNKKDIMNGKLELIKGDIEKMPFPDDYLDIITAFQTHYHWDNLDKKLLEIFRVLSEGGQFIIVAEKYKINYHMEKYKTKDELKNIFEEIGFKKIEYMETKYNMFIRGEKCKGEANAYNKFVYTSG